MGTWYLVVWWYSGDVRAAVTEDRDKATLWAQERNAVLVPIEGEDVHVGDLVDFYRRDEKGEPLPAVWRDLEKFPYRHD